MEIWKTLRVSHISTPPTATTNYYLKRRYTNIPLGTKNRSGQVEVADREFDRINRELPTDAPYELLKALERNYYKLTTHKPNPELSLNVIRLLLPAYQDLPTPKIIEQLDQVFAQNFAMFEHVYQDPDRAEDASAFFFQPEALMIFDRLLADRDRTLKIWNTSFPPSELERVATNFGLSLD